MRRALCECSAADYGVLSACMTGLQSRWYQVDGFACSIAAASKPLAHHRSAGIKEFCRLCMHSSMIAAMLKVYDLMLLLQTASSRSAYQMRMHVDFLTHRCRRYPLKDVEEQEIIPFFSQATEFINEAEQSGGKLLLHCHEGKSRSITLALAYLMQTKDWTLKQALEFVTGHRPCASPNAGFMTQLLKLEEKLHGKKTVKVDCLLVLCAACAASECYRLLKRIQSMHMSWHACAHHHRDIRLLCRR